MALAVSVVSSTSRVRSKRRVSSLRRAIASRARSCAAADRLLAITATTRKANERDPVLRIGDRERADRRQEEEVEREHRHDRRDDRDPQPRQRRGAEHDQQQRQRHGRGADVGQRAQRHREAGDGREAEAENDEITSRREAAHHRSQSHSDIAPRGADRLSHFLSTLYGFLTRTEAPSPAGGPPHRCWRRASSSASRSCTCRRERAWLSFGVCLLSGNGACARRLPRGAPGKRRSA